MSQTGDPDIRKLFANKCEAYDLFHALHKEHLSSSENQLNCKI